MLSVESQWAAHEQTGAMEELQKQRLNELFGPREDLRKKARHTSIQLKNDKSWQNYED